MSESGEIKLERQRWREPFQTFLTLHLLQRGGVGKPPFTALIERLSSMSANSLAYVTRNGTPVGPTGQVIPIPY